MNRDFIFGGNVKRKDLVEYEIWLKDRFYSSRDDVMYLKATDFTGLDKPENLGFENRSKFTFQILQFICFFLVKTLLVLILGNNMLYSCFH